jgi:hypothetical protein
MSAVRSAAAIAACALALAACGRHENKAGASSADSHAPGTTMATAPGSCSSYQAGTPGVIRTFCDGSAVVKVNVAGTDYVLKGGTCQVQGPMFVLNLGVVSGPELGGPKPDYVGLTTQTASGPFTNAVLTATVGGKGYALTTNSGTVSPTGGTFEGTAYGDKTKVTGSFTC